MILKKAVSFALCLVLAVAGLKAIPALTSLSHTSTSEEAASPDTTSVVVMDELLTDDLPEEELIIYGEMPSDVEVVEWEPLTDEELANIDWDDFESFTVDNAEPLAPVVNAEPMKVIDWGSKTFVNWYIEFKETVRSPHFTLRKGQYVQIAFTYKPSSSTVYAGFIDPDIKFHTYCFSSGTMNATFCAPKAGTYSVYVGNRAGRSLKITGYWRKSK